ncbi:c-type cytochrome [Noviherbaspirillum massiliense]|uniref:c-type cytochrome n=1 Tax=Noviherbaspirillum massiliense TaxID=1465823 RepID=UPI000308665A|nr:cytochrome c [Noviherbaspirillum massiliense]
MKPWPILLAGLLLVTGCEKAKQDMYDQPKYKPFRPSGMFSDGNSSRPLPEGSLPNAQGQFAGTSSGRVGADVVERNRQALAAQSIPYPVDMQLLRRGQERYSIYCLPCHSPVGDGDGLVARRGFPHPPSYHIDRLRQAPDRHFFDVISNGYGIMYSYGDRVEPPDRWAIVAYIRALQLSQHAEAASLPRSARIELWNAPEEGKR